MKKNKPSLNSVAAAGKKYFCESTNTVVFVSQSLSSEKKQDSPNSKTSLFTRINREFSLWVKVFCRIATVMAEIIFLTAISQTYSVKIDTLDQKCETT